MQSIRSRLLLPRLPGLKDWKYRQFIATGDKDKTDRKLLVSISRASEQFILLGNAEVLRTSKQYQELITQIESKNGFINKEFSENIITYLELIPE